MTEAVASLDFPAGADDIGRFRENVRLAGRKWARDRSIDLPGLLSEAAGDDPHLVELVRVGGRLLQDFLEGHRRRVMGERAVARPGDLAKALIAGRPMAPELEETLAEEYLVALVHPANRGGGGGARRTALCHAVDPDVLTTDRDSGLVLLVPGPDDAKSARTIKLIKQFFGGHGWLTTAVRARADVPAGFREVVDVMRLVLAGRRPCGAYTVSDVLVEYAVVQDEPVAESIVSVIRPLRKQTVLWETLNALIDADYHRNKAAAKLFIHRSTLDYRLQRIAAVTGFDPTTSRGAQVLAAAMVADAVRGTPAQQVRAVPPK